MGTYEILIVKCKRELLVSNPKCSHLTFYLEWIRHSDNLSRTATSRVKYKGYPLGIQITSSVLQDQSHLGIHSPALAIKCRGT